MDDTDRKLLDMLQDEFPLTERPFTDIGKKVGLTGEEVQERLRTLKASGYIRRIGPVLDPKQLGYSSLLCAAALEPGRLDKMAEAVNGEPSVTHNYEREGELNLWFTVSMRTRADIDSFLKKIEDTFSVTILRFPQKRTFKIKTRFKTVKTINDQKSEREGCMIENVTAVTYKRVYLVDGNSYLYRAFYATPHLSNSRGFPTNAIYAFVSMIKSSVIRKIPTSSLLYSIRKLRRSEKRSRHNTNRSVPRCPITCLCRSLS